MTGPRFRLSPTTLRGRGGAGDQMQVTKFRCRHEQVEGRALAGSEEQLCVEVRALAYARIGNIYAPQEQEWGILEVAKASAEWLLSVQLV